MTGAKGNIEYLLYMKKTDRKEEGAEAISHPLPVEEIIGEAHRLLVK